MPKWGKEEENLKVEVVLASSSTIGSNIPSPSTTNNPPPPPPRRRAGRPPLHPSSTNNHREQEYIPIANVIRVMRQVLPSNGQITDEAKETIQECISKFINYVSKEANEIRKVEQRKVISANDLVAAMSRLKLGHYAEPLLTYLNRYREVEGTDDFIQALRMRLFRPIAVRPGVAIVPPPVMADPYFNPHEGVGIGGDGGGRDGGVGQGHGIC
ncbi:nuclear transcription factor Y subunit B-6-like [Chenopodium quinoa]|uniref:nuclear transcription factor Y subunit B-6-like n=1 Tax=Chenopodium quinoa TaxID=63459 RepID=UPI000B78FD45|nr:nuclear transcription factor Y subunit B-6-like [Chenopodium quinoa]